MVTKKVRLNIEHIEKLLHGKDPEEGIRYIDANNFSPEVKLFIRKKEDEKAIVKKDTFRPFCWFKGFDFQKDFAWEYFAVNASDYNELDHCILYKGNVHFLDETLVVVCQTFDGTEVIVKRFLPNIEDRQKLCYAKMKEYGIEISEQITGLGGNKPIDRLENGFKYLVHINAPEEPKNYTNPYLGYTKNGYLKKINGSYNNLIDFFMEGGMDMYKKSGVFLDGEKLNEFWSSATNFQKLLFFFGFPMKNHLFTLVSEDEFEDDVTSTYDDERKQQFSIVDYAGLLDLTFQIFNEKVKTSNVFDFYEKKIKDKDLDFLRKYSKEFSAVLNLKIDKLKLFSLLEDDFSFESKKGFSSLNQYFIEHGIDVFYGEERLFYANTVLEQYMIQSGKRLFKGFEEYPELRIMTMDIETKAQEAFSHRNDAALHAHMGRIFKIGIYCNNGLELVLNASNDDEERFIIEEFFRVMMDNDPDLFLTYNGEGFDFPFIIKRYEILNNLRDEESSMNAIKHLLKDYYSKFEGVYISSKNTFTRRNGNLKVGGSSERYIQTNILGINACDTMFAVKRAAAINKNIPNFKLKDNIKFAKLAKPNRVYVDGGKIGAIENSPSTFLLNPTNGDYFKYNKEIIFEENEYEEKNIKKKAATTFIYGDENVLYIYDVKYDGDFMSSCENTLQFEAEDIKKFFSDLYQKFKNFDRVCFKKKNYAGQWLENVDGERFKLLRTNLKELRDSLDNKSFYYPEVNFDDYVEVTGAEIIKRYLIDDLWETAKLDEHYSQATFLISKWLPTSYQRAATMGGATVWKLLLTTYSYEYGIAIPEFDEPRDFSGGLVALISCGFHGQSFKADFSSLYPAEFYVHVDSPEIDIFGVYKLFMYYGWSTRIKYKKLMNEHKDKGEMELSKKFEVRQLPIKILINSFYGMMGAAGVTPFADLIVAQGITCSGRQHLRHLIKWFTEKGFYATIAHTDGVFFSINKADLSYEYVGRGINWLVKKEKLYIGIAAYVAEYNDLFMKGIMGLDIDEVVESVINFSKGNYIYMKKVKNKKTGEEEEKLEIIGGAIIKKTQSEYITQFVEKEVLKLMRGDSIGFLNAYWDYVGSIEDKRLNVNLITSKAKIKKSKKEYLEHIKGTNKNGQPLNRQVHMEMLINSGVDFDLGDTAFYVNTGKSEKDKDSISMNITFATCEVSDVSIESINAVIATNNRKKIKDFLIKIYNQGYLTVNKNCLDGDLIAFLDDIDTWKNVKTKLKSLKKGVFIDFIKTEFVINCTLVDTYKTDNFIDYNSVLYIDKFNKAVHPLFVVFKPELREKLMIKSRVERPFVLESDLELVNGTPFAGKEKKTQTSYEEVMDITKEEMEYWNAVQTNPEDFVLERK